MEFGGNTDEPHGEEFFFLLQCELMYEFMEDELLIINGSCP